MVIPCFSICYTVISILYIYTYPCAISPPSWVTKLLFKETIVVPDHLMTGHRFTKQSPWILAYVKIDVNGSILIMIHPLIG